MAKKRIVMAIGHKDMGTNLPEQKEAVKRTAKVIADFIQDGWQVAIVHSNAPQVGMIHTAMNEFGKQHDGYSSAPMSVCSAMSQGYIGYDLQNGIRAELTRGHQLVLCAGDHAHHGSRIEILGIEIELFHYVENDALLVVLIVDGERALKAEQVNVLAQNAQAGRVEGVRPDSGRGFLVTEGKLQTLAQLTRGFVGERDRNHLPRAGRIHRAQVLRAGAVLRLRIGQVFGQKQKIVFGRPVGRKFTFQSVAELENVDDAVDEHGRLAAACTRQDEQRTLGLIDSLALLVV